MSTTEGDITATARASPTSSITHPAISPSSNPVTPTGPLPQFFQPPQNSEQSTNSTVTGNQQHQQTLIVTSQPALPFVPGLDAASSESHIQAPLPNDGSSSVSSKEAVMLGLQALERQQEELERKRALTAVRRDNPFDAIPQHGRRSGYPQDFPYQGKVPSMVHLPTDEEDSQRTLSSINRDNSACDKKEKKGIGKLFRTPLKNIRRSSNKARDEVDPDDIDPSANKKFNQYRKALIDGYLYKRGRQGKWQRRWFESDGECLCYFKSKKRNKCLATLDLLNVGSVAMDDTDPADCSFTIEVAGRNYYLCAESKDHAMDWVISMNRVREARMEIGNLKLIEPRQIDTKLLDDDYAPRVGVVAPRKRAKGLGNEDFNEDVEYLIESKESENSNNVSGVSGFTGALSPASGMESMVSSNMAPTRQRSNRRVMSLVRWRKNRPSYQNWMRRLSRWAKRLRNVRCVINEDFQHLDVPIRGRHANESTTKSPLVDTSNLTPQGKNDGGLTVQNFPADGSFEVAPDPAMKYSHYTDLDPEIHVAGRTLNQISEGDASISDTTKSRTNDEAYPAYEQKTKACTSSWSHKRAPRKKLEDSSPRESITNEDVDSSSGRESPISFDDEASGVV